MEVNYAVRGLWKGLIFYRIEIFGRLVILGKLKIIESLEVMGLLTDEEVRCAI